jgi:endonuclease/exonuclease/phosphatase (EEP) superfamily protein YafD
MDACRVTLPVESRLRRWRGRAEPFVAGGCWVYLGAVLVLWILIETGGDDWWLSTVALFGPRWVWALPLIVLVPAALLVRPRSLWVLLNAAVVVVGPVMGFCVPWGRFGAQPRGEFSIRVLTCNMGSSLIDPVALAALIEQTQPDVVAVQEGSVEALPVSAWRSGWDVRTTLASRYPIRNVATPLHYGNLGGGGFVTCFDLETPLGIHHFVNLHLATPREGLESVKARWWRGASNLRKNISLRTGDSEMASRLTGQLSGPVLIAGDFNMPVESAIYRRFWSPYTDAFSSVGLGFGYTKFTRWFGARIDHILAGPGWRPQRCWVGPNVGSDHRPVIADLTWVGASD